MDHGTRWNYTTIQDIRIINNGNDVHKSRNEQWEFSNKYVRYTYQCSHTYKLI